METNQKRWEILVWLRAWALAKPGAEDLVWENPRVRRQRIKKFLPAAQQELERERAQVAH